MSPIKLPSTQVNVGFGTVAGWGSISPNGPLASQLQKLNVEIINHQDCIDIVKNHPYMDDNKLCTLTSIGKGEILGKLRIRKRRFSQIIQDFFYSKIYFYIAGNCMGDSGRYRFRRLAFKTVTRILYFYF